MRLLQFVVPLDSLPVQADPLPGNLQTNTPRGSLLPWFHVQCVLYYCVWKDVPLKTPNQSKGRQQLLEFDFQPILFLRTRDLLAFKCYLVEVHVPREPPVANRTPHGSERPLQQFLFPALFIRVDSYGRGNDCLRSR